jgi:hypothetical protein
MSDPRLRFRMWVGGHLVCDGWVDTSQPGAQQQVDTIQAGQLERAEAASAAGARWLIEVYNPEAPEDQAYLRFGTDKAGMHDPHPMTEVPLPGWHGQADEEET